MNYAAAPRAVTQPVAALLCSTQRNDLRAFTMNTAKSPSPSDHILRPAQVAERLGVSPSTLAKWRMHATGPPYLKLGRRVAYRATALHDWLTSRERTSTLAGR